MNVNTTKVEIVCDHCGEICHDDSIRIDDKIFCCNGCRLVYELLHPPDIAEGCPLPSQMDGGLTIEHREKYAFLDDEEIHKQILDFSDGTLSQVTFHIPAIHCSSCIWALEQLNSFHDGIVQSRVDFPKREIFLSFHEDKISLREVVELLASLGYEPRITLQDLERKQKDRSKHRLTMQIGVAGFAFGNIMLLSLPDYFSLTSPVEPYLNTFFSYLKLFLVLPAVFYCAQDYFQSAFHGLKNKIVNMDVPISLGIFVMFIQSSYDLFTFSGPGYFDSLTGLIFLLLVGKAFQRKTYDSFSFERDYKSYFPIAVMKKDKGSLVSTPVNRLQPGDRIVIRNGELIPADSILISDGTNIDYSFVTGESDPVGRSNGEMIYAGGRQSGARIELDVIQPVSQSYLTRLWENQVFRKEEETGTGQFVHRVSKYFTFIVLGIALAGALAWYQIDSGKAVTVFTSILIIACPCGIALTIPFTMGTALRILGANKLYLKSNEIIERLAEITHIIFDKTGTLTEAGGGEIQYSGTPLSEEDKKLISALAGQSTHPASIRVHQFIKSTSILQVDKFEEIPGKGISGEISGCEIKLGSLDWVAPLPDGIPQPSEKNYSTVVALSIHGETRGYFQLTGKYRPGTREIIERLAKRYSLAVLSGDRDRDRLHLSSLFPPSSELRFFQTPQEKLDYIKNLRQNGKKVLMLGDGLNDAGALKAGTVGIAVTENTSTFSPACDGLLEGKAFPKLADMLDFTRNCRTIIWLSFTLSFFYNVAGIGFAIAGKVSPLLSAILMPLASITIVIFTTASTNLSARSLNLK